MSGFVLLHRTLIGNPQFRGKDDEYAAMWLIAKAEWEAVTRRVGSEVVHLERGQIAHAVSYFGQAWECSKATAHARLRHFEKIGFIRTESRTGCTIVTICNYDEYQGSPNASRTHDQTRPERKPNAARTEIKEGKEDYPSSLRSDERAEAAPDADEGVKEILFGPGLTWLVKKAGKPEARCRALIGGWIKDHGEEVALSALRAAQKCRDGPPIEPVSWINAWLKTRKGDEQQETEQTRSERRNRRVEAALAGVRDYAG